MKRMLLAATATLAATAAFAAPAPAQDISLSDDFVVCTKPVTECARDLAVWGVNYTVNTVNRAGPIIGDICRDIFPACLMTP